VSVAGCGGGGGGAARLTALGAHCVKAAKKDAVGGVDFTPLASVNFGRIRDCTVRIIRDMGEM
jgi:hypothetical protein